LLIPGVTRFFEFRVALTGIITQGRTVRVQPGRRQNERFCFCGYYSSKQERKRPARLAHGLNSLANEGCRPGFFDAMT
jgi:hypothetical protein